MANTSSNKQTIKRPSLWLFASEAGRAVAEWGLFRVAKAVKRREIQGNGEPVVVIPGFMTTDRSTRVLRGFLDDLGYTSYPWDQGRNFGSPEYVFKMIDRIKAIYAEHQQKVCLIGWSLGGVYAREIAKEIPEMVTQVITLGSPFGGLTEDNNASWLYTVLSGKRVEDLDKKFIENVHLAPPVPVTAIYTKGDGNVSWQYCMETEDRPDLQNVAVPGSHCGLGHNITVLNIIANRLGQAADSWEPFRPSWLQQCITPSVG